MDGLGLSGGRTSDGDRSAGERGDGWVGEGTERFGLDPAPSHTGTALRLTDKCLPRPPSRSGWPLLGLTSGGVDAAAGEDSVGEGGADDRT
jgi:hypothetical protein